MRVKQSKFTSFIKSIMPPLCSLCENFSPHYEKFVNEKKTSAVKKKRKKSQTSARVKPRALERAGILIRVT